MSTHLVQLHNLLTAQHAQQDVVCQHRRVLNQHRQLLRLQPQGVHELWVGIKVCQHCLLLRGQQRG